MLVEKDIAIQTTILEVTDRGAILKVSLKGIHDHRLWPYGEKIWNFIKEEVRQNNPAAIVFDFKEYYYDGGNEIGGLIILACIDSVHKGRPFAIVAEGTTARCLRSLLYEGNLNRVIKFEFCDDSKSACAFLNRTLAEEPTSNNPPEH